MINIPITSDCIPLYSQYIPLPPFVLPLFSHEMIMQLCHYISLSLFPTIWSHHRVAPIYVNDSHKRGKSVILALNFTSFCSVGSNPVAWLFQTPRDRPRFQKNLLPVSPAKQAVGRVSLSGGSITWRWVKMLKWMWNGCERWITLACWPTQPYWVFWMWTQGSHFVDDKQVATDGWLRRVRLRRKHVGTTDIWGFP